MIKGRFEILEKQMLLKLEEIRNNHQHKGNKGTNVEVAVREFLRHFLPPKNRIGEGEVTDTENNISTQLDVIVTNEYHPFLNDLSVPSLFFIEGIGAVGEVKSILTLADFEKIIQNCIRFKSLKLKLAKGMMVQSNQEDLKRFVEHRPFFILAFESQAKLESIKNKFDQIVSEQNIPLEHQIDGIFLLGEGSLINFGTGAGAFQFITPNGGSKGGLIQQNSDHRGNALYFFLAWLSASMPQITLPSPPILSYLVAEKRLPDD